MKLRAGSDGNTFAAARAGVTAEAVAVPALMPKSLRGFYKVGSAAEMARRKVIPPWLMQSSASVRIWRR